MNDLVKELVHDWRARQRRAAERIEMLEVALRKIADGQRDADKSYAELFAEVRTEAREALEPEKGTATAR